MDVTPSGIVIDIILHPRKASSPIVITLLGIIVETHPAIKVLLALSIIALQLSRES